MRDASARYRIKRGVGIAMIVGLMIFALLPVLWALILAFRPAKVLFEPIWRSPGQLTLDNIGSIVGSDFPRALLNSFIAAGGSTGLSMLVGVPAGFALAKSRMSSKFVASWLLLLLRMAPPVGFVIPLYLLYIDAHLIDTYWGLIFAYMTLALPLVVWSTWTSFSQIPNELLEAALADGATVWQALLLVIIPAARPGVIAAGVLGFLVAWNDFFFALIITRSQTITAPVAIMNFVSYASVDWGAIAVASVALTLPVIPVILLANRYIVQSLGGAVKG